MFANGLKPSMRPRNSSRPRPALHTVADITMATNVVMTMVTVMKVTDTVSWMKEPSAVMEKNTVAVS